MKINLAIAVICLFLSHGAWATTQVTSIDFVAKDKTSQIEIKSNSPVVFDKQENTQDRQIVVDLKDTKLARTAKRSLDTSSFNSKVSLISPYSVDNGVNSRIVIQLRDMVQASVSQDGNILRITVPNGSADEAAAPPPETVLDVPAPNAISVQTPDAAPAPAASTPSAVANSAPAPSADEPPPPPPASMNTTDDVAGVTANQIIAPAAKPTPLGKLEQLLQNSETKRFTGKPITLQLRDADLQDAFRLIGDASGFNIVVGAGVTGKLTMSLVDVPWDQALDVILHTQKLGAERNNNLLRIVTLKDLTDEKMEESKAKQAAESNATRITRVFPISYASITDLVTILTKFASTANATGGAPGSTNLAIVQADARTNSIIVRDTADTIERMKKLIELLDTQTPQVQIEAKIIEASEGLSKNINGNLGFGAGDAAFGFNGATPGTDLVSGGDFRNGGTPSPSIGGGAGINLNFLSPFGLNRINSLIQIGESDSDAKIIAAPRMVVLNKESATILQSTPILVPSSSTQLGIVTNTSSVQQANLSLTVQPTITNEGSVLMQITVSRDVPQPVAGGQAVSNRNMTTKVLVESGSTLVMGGIYVSDQQKSSNGFPILRKIPIIGALFGQETTLDNHNELIFFITPRILNAKEAGLGT